LRRQGVRFTYKKIPLRRVRYDYQYDDYADDSVYDGNDGGAAEIHVAFDQEQFMWKMLRLYLRPTCLGKPDAD
jgi:hypothetical protein